MVGFPTDKNTLDARAGNIALSRAAASRESRTWMANFLFWSAQLCGVN